MKETINLIAREKSLTLLERMVAILFVTKGVETDLHFTQEGIAAELATGASTTHRALKRLSGMGVIVKSKTLGQKAGYRLTDPSQWRLSAKN